jgi:hypothetical protein
MEVNMSLFKKKKAISTEEIDLETLDKESNTRQLSGISNI